MVKSDRCHLGHSQAAGAGPLRHSSFAIPGPRDTCWGWQPYAHVPKGCPARQGAMGFTGGHCGNPTKIMPGLPATRAVGARP